jgi:radical SAM protein with 4Fe4S-binding SPASM domain
MLAMIRELFPPSLSVESLLPKADPRGEGRFRPSVFLFPLVFEGENCLYHTLTKACLGLEGELFARLRDGERFSAGEIAASPELRSLLDRRFLVPEDLDETRCCNELIRLLRLRTMRRRLSEYTILTTTACNARCFYCVEEGIPVVTMDERTIAQTVDFILRSRDPSRPIWITWFGGEPLAASGVIDRITAALTEAGVDFSSRLVTNGVLIDDAVLANMTGPWRLRYLQLSLDGEEKEYNRRKNYLRPYPSAYRVMKDVLRKASRTGIQIVLRCNVDEGNADGLTTMIDDLAETVEDRTRVLLYFAVLFSRQDSPAHAELFQRCMEARAYAREKGFPGVPIRSPHRLRTMYCGAENPRGSTLIYPDGRLFSCFSFLPEWQTGDVWHGLDRQEPLRSCALPEPVREACRDCVFLPICTSFSRCPHGLQQCRQVRRIELEQDLRWELERLGTAEAKTEASCEDPELIC